MAPRLGEEADAEEEAAGRRSRDAAPRGKAAAVVGRMAAGAQGSAVSTRPLRASRTGGLAKRGEIRR